MRNKYQMANKKRQEYRSTGGRFKGGKLAPVAAMVFRESESGVVTQNITYELDPVAGRMITEVSADVVSVYVPALAIDALKNPADDYPGNAEVFRQKLLSGSVVFDLEDEGEISKRCGIVPRSIGGAKKVNESVRIAHNAAVNYLRQRKYVKATQLLASNTAMTPALLANTVLDRLNAVLDPEDRVNGAIDFSASIPVKGLGIEAGATTSARTVRESDGSTESYTAAVSNHHSNSSNVLHADTASGYPAIFAELTTGAISLSDFYQSEKMDRLTREMRKMVDQNPQYGEELVNRFAHGLDVEIGNQPFVVYQKTAILGRNVRTAMDGASLDLQQTDMVARHSFTVPVPPTEFGGVLITFASIRPDETLASQPHPIASDTWQARNYVADEMAIDPVPVTVRDLYADCATGDENTITCYVGNNHLLKRYVNYGFNRHLNPLDVEDKTALWQLEVPMSVTPDSVIYPETLSHYPFNDQTAEVCTYTAELVANVNTPIIFGPAPVEELAEIETADIFEDATP